MRTREGAASRRWLVIPVTGHSTGRGRAPPDTRIRAMLQPHRTRKFFYAVSKAFLEYNAGRHGAAQGYFTGWPRPILTVRLCIASYMSL